MHPLVSLVISIAIIIILVVRFKMNPAASMFLGALIMGISTGSGLMTTVTSLTGGFGNTMGALGFSVGFGIMMGQLIAATGAVQRIAHSILKFFGEKKADYAMGSTGFVVSVPVFFDVAFVLMSPIARALAKSSKRSVAFFASAVVFGAGYAHTFVPPTPGPMTAAELAGVDLGMMIFWGAIVGLPTFLLGIYLYSKFFLKRPGFLKSTDIDNLESAEADQGAAELPANAPSFWLSMLPILLPIALILMGTFTKMAVGADATPEIIKFLGDKHVAMFIGFIAALFLCIGRLNLTQIQQELGKSLGDIGTVLFITGTGGALGAVIQSSGVGDALVGTIGQLNIPIVVFAWIVAGLLKVAQGSGTVAMITAITLVTPMIPGSGVSAVWVAMAACSGSLLGAHVNDSAFWVVSKLSGFSTQGGFKVYSLPCMILAIVSFLLIVPLSIIF